MQQHTLNISDLRRGNYIEYNGKWERVQDIVGDRVTFMDAPTYKEVPVKDCAPITIDQIVLSLCGFKQIPHYSPTSWYSLNIENGWRMGSHATECDIWVEKEINDMEHDAPPYYDICTLHMLQNLYKALKGIEIEITWP